MEFWFEIYFDFGNLGELGFREEKVYWGGEELSQDPVAYLSDNGLRFEEINDSRHFELITKEKMPQRYGGLVLKDQIISDLSLQINLDNDISSDPLIQFISGLNSDVDYVILLCRVDECATRKLYVNGKNDIINAVSEALNWERPQDIMLINRKIINQIKAVDWSLYETAYGNAAYVQRGSIPNMETILMSLFSSDRAEAIEGANWLESCLCHQHVYLSSAAYPACSILLYALKTLDEDRLEEVLFTILGFLILIPKDQPEQTWQGEMRKMIKAEEKRFVELAKSKAGCNSEYAEDILRELCD